MFVCKIKTNRKKTQKNLPSVPQDVVVVKLNFCWIYKGKKILSSQNGKKKTRNIFSFIIESNIILFTICPWGFFFFKLNGIWYKKQLQNLINSFRHWTKKKMLEQIANSFNKDWTKEYFMKSLMKANNRKVPLFRIHEQHLILISQFNSIILNPINLSFLPPNIFLTFWQYTWCYQLCWRLNPFVNIFFSSILSNKRCKRIREVKENQGNHFKNHTSHILYQKSTSHNWNENVYVHQISFE